MTASPAVLSWTTTHPKRTRACTSAWTGSKDFSRTTGISTTPLRAGIDNLNFVLADYNKIKDITVLESCRLLCQLDVWDNPIDQDGVKTLQDGGVIVNFNKNYKEDTAE